MTPVGVAPAMHNPATQEPEDTEITLGTGKMLAIFFGLVVLCATFFGLGYSIGHNSVKTTAELLPSPSTSRGTRVSPSAIVPTATAPQPDSSTKPADSNRQRTPMQEVAQLQLLQAPIHPRQARLRPVLKRRREPDTSYKLRQ